MKEYIFTLQVITPLFISGADQREAELRPPSIRGALRFWFRAMVGGVVGGDRESVKDLEAKVFGDTKRMSKFGIRVKTLSSPKPAGRRVGRLGDGIAYMGAGALLRRERGGVYILTRGCYWPPDSPQDAEIPSFRMRLLLRTSDQHIKDILLGTIWLLTTFGGLGSRIRRGFGSIAVKQAPPEYDEKYKYDQGDIIEYLKDKLRTVADACKALAERCRITTSDIFNQSSQHPLFSCFSRWRLIVVQDDNWGGWKDVMDSMGRHLRGFRIDPGGSGRFGSTYDYRYVSLFLDNNLQTGTTYDFRNDAFGLPIQYRSYSRSTRGGQVRALLSPSSRGIDRRASPLIIRPILIGDRWFVLLLFFNAEFLPDGTSEVLSPIRGGWPRNRPIPQPVEVKAADINLIDYYLNEVKRSFRVLGELP